MLENESTPSLLNEDSRISSPENFQIPYRGMKPDPPILWHSVSTNCATGRTYSTTIWKSSNALLRESYPPAQDQRFAVQHTRRKINWINHARAVDLRKPDSVQTLLVRHVAYSKLRRLITYTDKFTLILSSALPGWDGFIFYFLGATARRGPGPPHSRGF